MKDYIDRIHKTPYWSIIDPIAKVAFAAFVATMCVTVFYQVFIPEMLNSIRNVRWNNELSMDETIKFRQSPFAIGRAIGVCEGPYSGEVHKLIWFSAIAQVVHSDPIQFKKGLEAGKAIVGQQRDLDCDVARTALTRWNRDETVSVEQMKATVLLQERLNEMTGDNK